MSAPSGTSVTPDPRLDRLYQLLPAIYRMRDAQQDYKLQALLRVIAEQVNLLEDDIGQLYENWFIETAEDWVVPYLADLLGLRPVSDPAGNSLADVNDASARALARVLVPRREAANTVRYRRRKGTLALLELLAHDVGGWPARAQEFYRLLGWNQNLNHQHIERARTLDVRAMQALDWLDGPFQCSAHSVDVRRIADRHLDQHLDQAVWLDGDDGALPAPGGPVANPATDPPRGWMNPASIGVFIWRLKSYGVHNCAAYCHEKTGPQCYTFSVLGQDVPLYILPQAETDDDLLAQELNTPSPIRRRALQRNLLAFYGADKSLAIWGNGWADYDPGQPVPAAALIVADLSDWTYTPPLRHIAIDPELGRFAFPPAQLPRKGVKVNYHYAFSTDMGGGEYPRTLFSPAPRQQGEVLVGYTLYRVGKDQPYPRIGDALSRWRSEQPQDGVIEIADSAVYTEPVAFELLPMQSLQIRAASGARPVLRLLDWQTDAPDSFSVGMGEGSRFVLDGLLVTGCSLCIGGPATVMTLGGGDAAGKGAGSSTGMGMSGADTDKSGGNAAVGTTGISVPSGHCAAELVIRHCTLVPGWGLECDCEPKRPAEPSLELSKLRARVRIEHSILGSIQLLADEVQTDPLPLCITDSIIDATAPFKEAIGAVDTSPAFCLLSIARSTVFGITNVHAIELAQDSIFTDCLNVARRQIGCMRFCYIKPACRTPRRYHCQPDLAFAAATAGLDDPLAQEAARAREALRLAPQFTSERYGSPGYAQLGRHCAVELQQGAESGSEMGVLHDLYQAQRQANLQTRLEEYCAAGMQVGIVVVN